ncbi:MAG: hypothetical protein A2Y16_00075 [Tenericutes bacterium GWF2_57_13]|nr:MAG: hypothetical protein A2Y16_00075 [Tenericutes bacterium GWF2_57_13]
MIYSYTDLVAELKDIIKSAPQTISNINITKAISDDLNGTILLAQQLCVDISLSNLETYKKIKSIEIESVVAAIHTYRFHDPYVGAVLIRKTESQYYLDACCRGAIDGDSHAEFTLLKLHVGKKKYSESDILLTTLEPCTKESRKQWSIPCSDLISQSGIRKVYIGVLDPNPIITGNGTKFLLDKGIDVIFFEERYRKQITQNNKVFLDQFQIGNPSTYKDIFDTFINYLDLVAMEYYLAYDLKIIDKNEEFESKYESLSIERKYSNIFYFFKNMTLNRSILSADREVTKYTCTDDFALFFFNNPKKIVDSATLRLINSSANEMYDSDQLIDSSLFMMVDRIETEMKKRYSFFVSNTSSNMGLSYLKRLEIRMFPNVHKNDYSILREVIVNALVHRDYKSPIFTVIELNDDFISIKNPVTSKINTEVVSRLNMFTYNSDPTNSRLMRFFMDATYCERKSNGMKLAKEYAEFIQYKLDGNILETRLNFSSRR